MVRARIPELGERVQFGPLATVKELVGVRGQVIRVEARYVPKLDPLGRENGHDKTNLYIATPLTYNGKRVVVKASPYEIDGALD